MNKLLIVLLAVCLISVHAFVKRDAPAPAEQDDPMKKIGETISNFGETLKSNIEKVMNPDVIKKNVNDFIDNVSNKVAEFKVAPKQD